MCRQRTRPNFCIPSLPAWATFGRGSPTRTRPFTQPKIRVWVCVQWVHEQPQMRGVRVYSVTPNIRTSFLELRGLEAPRSTPFFRIKGLGVQVHVHHIFRIKGLPQDHKIFTHRAFRTAKLNQKKTACVFSLIDVEMRHSLRSHSRSMNGRWACGSTDVDP